VKILIAVEDQEIRASAETTLRRTGHHPVFVTDGEATLEALGRDEFRFVIADCSLPGVNGLDVCRAIRRQRQVPYVYVLLLVDCYCSQEVTDGIFVGADDFLAKPPFASELTARIKYGESVLSHNCREPVAFVLARMAEMRDCFMGRHLERLQHYCRCLAEAMREELRLRPQIDAEFIRLLYESCALHDIGKFCIPDSILLKPGRLNDEEFSVIKTHPTVGAGMLDVIGQYYADEQFPQMARDIVIAHHERWDGQGYPCGLAGEDIPLAARIVTLADIYDALTSKRVYHEAVPHATARDVITSEAGRRLDPGVVTAFCRAEPKFMQIRWRFAAGSAGAVACAV